MSIDTWEWLTIELSSKQFNDLYIFHANYGTADSRVWGILVAAKAERSKRGEPYHA